MRRAIMTICATLMMHGLGTAQAGQYVTSVPGVSLSSWNSPLPQWTGGSGCQSPDGRAYESEHFLVLGNGTSDANRQKLSDILELAYTELAEVIGFSESDMGISTASLKILVCADLGNSDLSSQGSGGYRSMLLNALDAPVIPRMNEGTFPDNDWVSYRALVRHELAHVVNQILRNEADRTRFTERWFSEGFATLTSNYPPLSMSVDDVRNWTTTLGYKNPISIRQYSDRPNTQQDNYMIYALTVRWLTDTVENGGAGNTMADVVNMFKRSATEGSSFSTSFGQEMKRNGEILVLSSLEANWQTWMNAYLEANPNILNSNQEEPIQTSIPNSTDPLTVHFSTTMTASNYFIGWSFGDGIEVSGKEANHTYGSPGAYEVTLTVIDTNNGGVTRYTKQIEVVAATPEGTNTTTSADCLFSWAEQQYPSLLSPAGATSGTLGDYYYRHYSNTNAYLATSSADNHLYYLGPATGNVIADLGALSNWLPQAGCQ